MPRPEHGSEEGGTTSDNTLNKKIAGLYNASAIPYDKRPPPPSKTMTPKQQYREFVKSIKKEGIDGMPADVRLRVEYKKYRQSGLDHKTAESQARLALNLPRNQNEFMEFQAHYHSNGIKRTKDGLAIHNPSHHRSGTFIGNASNIAILNDDADDNNNNNNNNNSTNTGTNGLPTTTTAVSSVKRRKPAVVSILPTISFKDVGGIDNILWDLRRIFQYPLLCPEIFAHLNTSPTRGVLLHGPPGCGKTLLAHAIAGELNIPMIKLNATEIVSKLSGESENKIRQVFQDAITQAPCIIFIDELDAIAGKKEESDREMSRRIVSQLMVSIDSLDVHNKADVLPPPPPGLLTAPSLSSSPSLSITTAPPTTTTTTSGSTTPASPTAAGSPETTQDPTIADLKQPQPSESELALQMNEDDAFMTSSMQEPMSALQNIRKHVFIIGAATKIDGIDPGLRRSGRFDKEIALGIPDEHARTQILRILTKNMTLAPECDLEDLGKRTVGFVGADLVTLTNEAGMGAIDRAFNDAELWDKIISMKQASDHQSNLSSREKQKEAREEQSDKNDGMDDFDHLTLDEDDSINNTSGDHDNDSDSDSDIIDISSQKQLSSAATTIPEPTKQPAQSKQHQKPQQQDPQPQQQQKRHIVNTDSDTTTDNDHDKTSRSLARESLLHRIREVGSLSPSQLALISVQQNDFISAMKNIEATAKREGFAMVPTTTWDDVGGLDLLRDELFMQIVHPIRNPELYQRFNLKAASGVLLFGPPGCGKTLIAQAVANASSASFMSVKGPELLNQYVGESERAVRQIFTRARACAPCVIFFDEIDAIAPHRGSAGNHSSERVVAQLLTELDGVGGRGSVFVIAATNRPDTIDKALLRPGRLGSLLYVPLPDAAGRCSILSKQTKRLPLDYASFTGKDDNEKRNAMIKQIAESPQAEGFSGADITALVNAATRAVFTESMLSNQPQSVDDFKLRISHFKTAFTKIRASVDPKSRQYYDKLCQQVSQGKAILQENINTIKDGSQAGSSGR